MTTLDYNIEVNYYGDEACDNQHINFKLSDSNGVTFHKSFWSSDVEKSTQPGGFNYSVFVDTATSESAQIHYKAADAVHNQTQSALGWVSSNEIDCQMNVVDFCLD